MSINSCASDSHIGNLTLSTDRRLSMSSKIIQGANTEAMSSNSTPNSSGITSGSNTRRGSDPDTAPRDIRHTNIIRTQTAAVTATRQAAAASILLPSDLTATYQYDEPDEDEYNMHIGSQRIYTDEHPEPELLPTVVGKDSQGRIIPSTSTISLLSLNQQEMSSPKIMLNGLSQQQPVSFSDRKNSFGQLRNLLTHKRLPPYQKINSPNEYVFTTTTTTSTSTTSTTSAQSISINDQHIPQPPSPNLAPVSLGGSPARFWLTSPTPPKSLSKTQLYQIQYTHHQQENITNHHYHSHKQTFLPLASIPQSSQPPLFQEHSNDSSELYINIEHKSGSHSPTLNPVQTPAEDPPMTPLFLNKAMNGAPTDYFNLDSVIHNAKKEDNEETNETL